MSFAIRHTAYSNWSQLYELYPPRESDFNEPIRFQPSLEHMRWVGSSTGNLYLYSNAGPYGVTWVAAVLFGLNGGDNAQYASFTFTMFDNGQGGIEKGDFGGSTLNWIQQGISFSGSMTASFVQGINLVLNVNNPDGVSQCFNVYVTLWYY